MSFVLVLFLYTSEVMQYRWNMSDMFFDGHQHF